MPLRRQFWVGGMQIAQSNVFQNAEKNVSGWEKAKFL